MKQQINIRKHTGELEPFDGGKFRESLRRSGASDREIEEVLNDVLSELHEEITTQKIYRIAYAKIRKLSQRSAGRYKLKKALFQLGPTGFPFEHFVARLLEIEGYQVRTGQIIRGKCVEHEVDVVAKKPGKMIMAECKFHQTEGAKSDVKTSLYVRSRFHDIKNKLDEQKQDMIFEPMLITNTRFTLDAEQYGKCSGLKLLSWDFPKGNSLKDWIDRSGFHPITVLKSLTKKETKILIDKGIVLCREIKNNPDVLNDLPITQRRKSSIVKEATSMSPEAGS
ncbi:MAG: restriction endonuclease [Bacteroidales bacterium]|nr:restriction endonuclease [Bacteroidales bacterium]MCF8375313.1 restriction endonuclease [Bacteroidales bacterium]MCF8400169.1 restriction endonuclease [Bacteroidales bacterium]